MNKQDLPKYQCHKIVQAMQIGMIEDGIGGHHRLYPINSDMGRDFIVVEDRYVQRHTPRVGGYYVLYEDGYESYSPKDAFEQGYTRLDRLGETVADLNEEAGYEEAQEPLPLYDKYSECPKCGEAGADARYSKPNPEVPGEIRRTCNNCGSIRWERPLDDSRHGSTVFAGPGKNV